MYTNARRGPRPRGGASWQGGPSLGKLASYSKSKSCALSFLCAAVMMKHENIIYLRILDGSDRVLPVYVGAPPFVARFRLFLG